MASFFDVSGRGKMLFTGPQARWFLDQLVSNKVVDLPAERGAEALLLSPRGKIEAVMRILHLGDRVFADLDSVAAGPVVDFFNGRVFATKVQVADVTGDYGMIRVLGTDAAQLLEMVIGLTGYGESQNACAAFPQGLVAALTRPAVGFDVWTERAFTGELVRRLEAAGAAGLTTSQYEDIRVTGGLPLFGRDFDNSYLPQEAALELAVHFEKGCYLGQEAVAMAQRGRIKRRLRQVLFGGIGAPGEIRHEGREAGRVTSVGTVDGRWLGIASVKTFVPAGEEIVVVPDDGSHQAATTGELPGTIHGPKVPSARELRERLGRG